MLWMTGDSGSATRDNPGPERDVTTRPVDSVDERGEDTRPTMSGTNAMSSTIHRPYYYDYREFQVCRNSNNASEEAEVKFRCERDTLAEAVATAQRTVASRTGALPVLQDLRITASGDGLELVGSDLEITNRVQVPAEVEETGVAVVPKMLGDIVRKLEPGPGHGRGHRRRGGDHRRPVLDLVAPEAGRGLPALGVERRSGCAARRRRVRAGAAPGRARGVEGRSAADPHRCVAHDPRRWPAPGRDRLVPARGSRPEGREHARRGPARARRGEGSRRKCSAWPATARSKSCCANATSCSARRAPRSPRG